MSGCGLLLPTRGLLKVNNLDFPINQLLKLEHRVYIISSNKARIYI